MSRLVFVAAFYVVFGCVSVQSVMAQTSWTYQNSPMVSAGQVCPKCGRIHAPAHNSVAPVSYNQPVANAPMMQPSQAISNGRSTSDLIGGSRGSVSNVLSALNAQRARQGLSALGYDPSLQAVAQRRAQLMAQTGNKSHPPGSFSPGRYEGVGWHSSYSPSGVSACFTSDPNMQVAGAAMATGRDGVYFCVVYR